jgi:cysteine desulfurase
MKQIYLDNAATTKVDEKVAKEMQKYLTEVYGNASSVHFAGQEARRAIEESRKIIAKEIGANVEEIIFTGSGTESNNLVIKGLFWENFPEKNHIITTKIEHDCVLKSCEWIEQQGGKITYLDVDKEGFVNLKQLKDSITDKTILVSVIHGNNEIGTIQDLEKIGAICKKKKVLFHTDACQSFTKVSINIKKMNLDLVTLNAHKIHGPKGVGALYLKKGIKITPLLHGGGHEFGIRSSTENVAGIVGFAKAVKVKGMFEIKNVTNLRDYFISELQKIPNVNINGAKGDKRLCNNINVCFNNIEAESIGSFLNSKGIFTSVGSACSSHNLEPSHVLMALGKTHLEANSSIRISISKYTTKEEIDYALKEIKNTVNLLRKISPFA